MRWLCQMAVVRARMRWATRAVTPLAVRAPWRSRPSWSLRVSKTDSMRCRRGRRSPAPGRGDSVAGRGTQQGHSGAFQVGLELSGAVALVSHERLVAGGLEPGEHVAQDLTLIGTGIGKRPRYW